MSSSYYDVIVLGAQTGPLCAAALLAKRGFRVLVLGQDALSPSYIVGDYELQRVPFNFQYAATPVAQLIFGELGIRQELRQRTEIHQAGVQLCLPKHRFVLTKDTDMFTKEVGREFPKIQSAIAAFARRTAPLCRALDRRLPEGLPFPPDAPNQWLGFLLQYYKMRRMHAVDSFDLLSDFPANHAFTSGIRALVSQFVPSGERNNFQVARAFERARSGISLRGGPDALRQLLSARILAHGGEVWPTERASSVLLERNVAAGIRVHNSGQTISAGYIIAGSPLSHTIQMVEDRRPFEALLERVGEPRLRCTRYTLNVVVPKDCLPDSMFRDTLVIADPTQPIFDGNLLHVQRLDAPPASHASNSMLCVQAMLSPSILRGPKASMQELRQTILDYLGRLLPFTTQAIVLADSPHDGLDADDLGTGSRVSPAEPWHRGPSTMPQEWNFPVRPALGLGAIPIRTPIRKLLICNSQNIPGLAEEGTLIAALIAANIISRADKRAWLRKGRWYSHTYAN
ncbi:MAG: hypothetical protein H6714_10275 [Myxococcales bacterium]|nr:hypothetical protein [Myxococcales bacterium]